MEMTVTFYEKGRKFIFNLPLMNDAWHFALRMQIACVFHKKLSFVLYIAKKCCFEKYFDIESQLLQ